MPVHCAKSTHSSRSWSHPPSWPALCNVSLTRGWWEMRRSTVASNTGRRTWRISCGGSSRRGCSSRRRCVPALYTYDYAIIRLVPRVEREEFVNVGVIVSCPACGFLEARIALDEQRLLALDASLDMVTIRAHLATILTMCTGGASAGTLGHLPPPD